MKAGMSFGVWLQQRRRMLDLTQKQLAHCVVCSVATIRKLETDERRPSAELAERLAECLNIDAEEYEHFIVFARSSSLNPAPLLTQTESSSPKKSSIAEEYITISGSDDFRASPTGGCQDWGEAPDVSEFIGRERELSQLEKYIVHERCRLVGVLGMGGMGKTALATAIAMNVQDQFDCLVWRSLRNAPPVEEIVEESIQLLSDQQVTARSAPLGKNILLLLDLLRKQRCLLVFDNVETILDEKDQAGRYRPSFEGYGDLFRRIGETEHGSCLLLTSREKPKEFSRLEGESTPIRSLQLTAIEPDEGRSILADKGLYGTDESWLHLTERYAGNPLALKVVAETIRELFSGDIGLFLAEEMVIFGGIRDLLTQQFERLSDLEQELMIWLAIEREAVAVDMLRDNLVQPAKAASLFEALQSLRQRSLIETMRPAHESTQQGVTFTLQNVVMEYLTERFVGEICTEIQHDTISHLQRYVLLKAQAKEYVRESQVRLILHPVAERLLATLGQDGLEARLQRITTTLRTEHLDQPGYAGGNLLNLLLHIQSDLHGWDFSGLAIWQAYLRGRAIRDVNFAHADLTKTVFTDTFGAISAVTFSPNGQFIAAATTVGMIRIWRAEDGQPTLTRHDDMGMVYGIAFSPDGRLLAVGHPDYTIRLWDITAGQCICTLRGHTDVIRSVAFHPTGALLASGSADQSILLWDVRTVSDQSPPIQVLHKQSNRILSVAFSPKGNLLASASQDTTICL